MFWQNSAKPTSSFGMNRNSFFAQPIGLQRVPQNALKFLGEVIETVNKALGVFDKNNQHAKVFDDLLKQLTETLGCNRNLQQPLTKINLQLVAELVNKVKEQLVLIPKVTDEAIRRTPELINFVVIEKSLDNFKQLCINSGMNTQLPVAEAPMQVKVAAAA